MWHLNIPKILHVYWGGKTLSYLRYLTLKTFNLHNPDWVIKVHHPKELYTGGKNWNHEEIDVVSKDYFSELENISNVQMVEVNFKELGIGDVPEVYRSDLLRLKLLGTEGGIYSDMDILYFKSLEEMYFNNEVHSNVDTIVSFHPEKHHYSIGFLGASKNNEFYRFLFEKGMERIGAVGDYQQLGVIMWKHYFPNPKFITKKFPNLNVFDIQMVLCYFLDSTNIKDIYEGNVPLTNPRTIALHWYCGHPISPIWQNKIEEGNFHMFNTTLTNTIMRAFFGEEGRKHVR